MWMGLWRKFGADLYVRMASFDNDTLLSVLFGNFELVGDILNINDKLNFYGFLARGSNYIPVSLICICYICYVLSCLYIFHVFFSLCSPYLEEIKKSSSSSSL